MMIRMITLAPTSLVPMLRILWLVEKTDDQVPLDDGEDLDEISVVLRGFKDAKFWGCLNSALIWSVLQIGAKWNRWAYNTRSKTREIVNLWRGD